MMKEVIEYDQIDSIHLKEALSEWILFFFIVNIIDY
jgi:hypothetical protein